MEYEKHFRGTCNDHVLCVTHFCRSMHIHNMITQLDKDITTEQFPFLPVIHADTEDMITPPMVLVLGGYCDHSARCSG